MYYKTRAEITELKIQKSFYTKELDDIKSLEDKLDVKNNEINQFAKKTVLIDPLEDEEEYQARLKSFIDNSKNKSKNYLNLMARISKKSAYESALTQINQVLSNLFHFNDDDLSSIQGLIRLIQKYDIKLSKLSRSLSKITGIKEDFVDFNHLLDDDVMGKGLFDYLTEHNTAAFDE